MRNFKKIIARLLLITILLTGFSSFAQFPGGSGVPGDSEDGTDVQDNPVPIDNHLIVTLVAGACIGLYSLRKNQVKSKSKA